MDEQNINVDGSNIDQLNVAARDVNIAAPVRPVLNLELSKDTDGSNRWLVLRNVGGSPALDVEYSLSGEGGERKADYVHAVGAGDEIPLTLPFANKDGKKQLSDLKRQPVVAATYKDVQGREYRFTHPPVAAD